jgi:hypothetical protein
MIWRSFIPIHYNYRVIVCRIIVRQILAFRQILANLEKFRPNSNLDHSVFSTILLRYTIEFIHQVTNLDSVS